MIWRFVETLFRQFEVELSHATSISKRNALITSVGLGGAVAAQRPFLGRAADIFGGGEGQEPEPSRRGSRPQPNDGGARNQAPAGRDRRATRHVHQDGRRPYAQRREIGLGATEGRSRDFCADGRLTRREQLDGGGGAAELLRRHRNYVRHPEIRSVGRKIPPHLPADVIGPKLFSSLGE